MNGLTKDGGSDAENEEVIPFGGDADGYVSFDI